MRIVGAARPRCHEGYPIASMPAHPPAAPCEYASHVLARAARVLGAAAAPSPRGRTTWRPRHSAGAPLTLEVEVEEEEEEDVALP